MGDLVKGTVWFSLSAYTLYQAFLWLRPRPWVLSIRKPWHFQKMIIAPTLIIIMGLVTGWLRREDVRWLVVYFLPWFFILIASFVIREKRVSVLKLDVDTLQAALGEMCAYTWHMDHFEPPPFEGKVYPLVDRSMWNWVAFEGKRDYLRIAIDSQRNRATLIRVGTWEDLDWQRFINEYSAALAQREGRADKLMGYLALVQGGIALIMAFAVLGG